MKLALISLNQIWEDKIANLERCEVLLQKAKIKGATMAILPEMTLTGYTMNISGVAEEEKESQTLDHFIRLSKKYNITIVGGIVLKINNVPANTLVVIDENGIQKQRYIKIHPFSLMGEDKFVQSGNNLVIVNVADFTFGLTICYDLRFPELYSNLSKNCTAIINIANWPKKRLNHWNILLKARAIENQLYMIGVNRIGSDGNGIEYDLSSVVVDANGDKVDPDHSESELDIVDINLENLLKYRESFPTFRDRRDDIYMKMVSST
jgi:predicted amidohydrolase